MSAFTRRGLFGLVGRIAAAAGLAKVAASMPAAKAATPAPLRAEVFHGAFRGDPLLCVTSSITVCGRPTWFPTLANTNIQPLWEDRFTFGVGCGPETLAERVRRRIAASRSIRRSHPAARLFWGLP